MTASTDRQPTSIRLNRHDRALLDALQTHTGMSTIGVIRLGLVSAAKLLGVPVPADRVPTEASHD